MIINTNEMNLPEEILEAVFYEPGEITCRNDLTIFMKNAQMSRSRMMKLETLGYECKNFAGNQSLETKKKNKRDARLN